MPRLRLSLACGPYETTRALWDGTIEPDGIELTVLTGDRDRIFHVDRRQECDVAEFNVMNYMVALEAGVPITALPVFPHRRFRHGFIFVNTAAGILEPADLAGRKVGMAGSNAAATIWIKGILNEHYGVAYDAVEWVDLYSSPNAARHPMLGDLAPAPPAAGRAVDSALLDAVDALLSSGELEALIGPGLPGPILRRDPRVGRLFPDARREEIRYYEKTGIFPIMHIVTIKKEVLAEHPWAAASLSRAFEQAKRLAYDRVRNPRIVPLVFFEDAWEDQERRFGDDPWEFGLGEANRRNLEAAARYAFEQHLVGSLPEIDEIVLDVPPAAFIGGTAGF